MERHERRQLGLVLAAAALYAASYVATWPAMYSTVDEASYVGTALTFARGHVFADEAGVDLAFPVHGRGGHAASGYPPGWPLLLAPVAHLGPAPCFLVSLALHLAAVALLARLLWALGRDPGWALLLLFYPAAVLYSRTLMANGPTMVLVLAGAVLYLAARLEETGGRTRPLLLAGFCLGLAGLMRLPAFGLVFVFSLTALWRARVHGRRAALRAALLVAAGAAAPAVLTAGYNLLAFGSALRTGHHLVPSLPERLFALRYAWPKLLLYAGLLLVFYPGLAAAPFLARGRLSVEARLALAWYLAVYGSYYYLEHRGGRFEIAVKSLRFFLPVVPLLLVSYAELWERLASRGRLVRWRRVGLALAALGLCAGAFVLQRRHAAFQRELASAREAVYAASADGNLIVSTMDGLKLLQNAWWGERGRLDIHDADLTGRVRAAVGQRREAYLVLLERQGRSALWGLGIQRRRETLASEFRLEPVPEAERAGAFWRLRVERIAPRN